MTYQNFIRTLEIDHKRGWLFHKIFKNSHLKYGKMKKQKLKNNIFDGPLILNQTFSQTEFIFGRSDFAQIMHFPQTKYLIFVKFENISH